MGAMLNRLESTDANVLWLEYTGYAEVLLKGPLPWLDVVAFVAGQRRMQGLLRSDVVGLALDRACASWIAAHPDLAAAMGAKSRRVFPLKTLLAADGLRAHLAELANSLRSSISDALLALVLPSPRAWIAAAHAQAFAGSVVRADDEEADSASVYVADFLRAFAGCGIDVVLLEERPEFVPASAAQIACYRAVLNVASNYRWDAGLRAPAMANDTAGAGFDFLIGAQDRALPGSGVEIPEAFWSGAPAPEARLRYAVIPARCQPESVLERLAELR